MKYNTSTISGTLALIASALILSGCSGSKDPNAHLEKAKSFVDSEQYASAEIEIRNALSKESNNAQAIALQGKIFFEQGRLRDAYKTLSYLKQIGTADALSLARLASIQAAVGIPDEAEKNARAALALDPDNLQALIALVELARDAAAAEKLQAELKALPPTASTATAQGALYFKSGDVGSAEAKFKAALSIDPGLAEAHSGLFLVYASRQEMDKAKASIGKAAEVSKLRSASKIHYVTLLSQTDGEPAAIEYLEQTLAKAPDYLPALTLQAELKLRAGEQDEAKKLIERALKLDPLDMKPMFMRGLISFNEGKIEKSIEQLKSVVELYPDNLSAHYQIALAYLKNDENQAAKKHLVKVRDARPNNLEASTLLSNIQAKEGDYAGAIITWERFLKTTPDSIEGRMMLADVLNKKGDHKTALAIYQDLEKKAPKDPTLNYLSGISFLKAKDPQKARSSFETVLENYPDHLQSIEHLTAIDLNENKTTSALQRIEQTIAAAPEVSALHAIRAQILQNAGDTSEAEIAFLRAIELDPQNESARLLLARSLRTHGKNDQALSQLEATLEINPDNVAALAMTANIFEQENRYPDAIKRYERILQINPNDVHTLNNLSYIYSNQQNNSDKALELAERARSVAPNDPYIADTLGWIAFKRGDYAWSLTLLQESYAKLPKIQEVAYHLGSAYYALGKRPEAINLLSKATLESESYIGFDDAKRKLELLKLDPLAHSEAAKEVVDSVLSADKNDPFALVYLAGIQSSNNEIAKAIESYDRALKASPNNLEAQVGIAKALVAAGNKSEAIKFADKAAKQDPNNQTVLGIQGQIAFETKEFSWAINRFTKQLSLAPQNPESAKALALSHFALGNLDASEKSIDEYAKASASEDFKGWKPAYSFLRDRSSAPVLSSETTGPMKQLLAGYEALQRLELAKAESEFKSVLLDYPDQVQAKLGLAEALSHDSKNYEAIAKLASEAREKDSGNLQAKALEAISLLQSGKTDQAGKIAKTIEPANRRKLGEGLETRIAKIIEAEGK